MGTDSKVLLEEGSPVGWSLVHTQGQKMNLGFFRVRSQEVRCYQGLGYLLSLCDFILSPFILLFSMYLVGLGWKWKWGRGHLPSSILRIAADSLTTKGNQKPAEWLSFFFCDVRGFRSKNMKTQQKLFMLRVNEERTAVVNDIRQKGVTWYHRQNGMKQGLAVADSF